MKISLLIVLMLYSLVSVGQYTKYDNSLLEVPKFVKEIPSDIKGPKEIRGDIPFRPEGLYGNNEKYIKNDVFSYGQLNINGFSSFIYSENFPLYIRNVMSQFTSYLVLMTSEPYMIRVSYSHPEGPTVGSSIYDNILIITEYIDPSYDLELEGQGETSYMSRFVMIEFQDDGSFKVLDKDEALTLALELEPDTFRNIELL